MVSRTIRIELSVKQQALLLRQLERGHYENLIEVFDDALRLMNDRDAVFSEWLREEVRASLTDKHPPSPVFTRVRVKAGCTTKAARRCG